MSKLKNPLFIVPVLLSFFVMSFLDLVGIGVDRVSSDLNIDASLAQLIPSAAFLWFLLLSVPVGVVQAKYGKKRMLNIGMLVTAVGLLVPFFFYSFAMVLIGFALLGIGNTIIQVSANPLLIDVVSSNRASSFMSFSQFIKAIGSMLGPPLAALFAAKFGDWKILFLVYGLVSILAVAWLGSVKITESVSQEERASFLSSFRLLKTRFIALMVLSIFVVVGIDVGFNSNSGQFLMNSYGMGQVEAESGRSIYFFGKMLGTLTGAIILTRFSSRKMYLWSAVLGILAIVLLLAFKTPMAAWVIIFIIGLAIANIFPLVFAITVQKFPNHMNAISGLMMMAICGGAVIPPLMGWITFISKNVFGMAVLLICLFYLLAVSIYVLKQEKINIHDA
jgi:fucose permease